MMEKRNKLIKKIIRKRWYFGVMCGWVVLILFCFVLPHPLFNTFFSTVLLDGRGDILGVMAAKDGQLRFEGVDVLPAKYAAAVIAFEDKRFAFHGGVDWLAFSRALVQNITSGRIVSGGSTLSMQVVRLSRNNPPRTFTEKIREIILTFCLEQQYTKQEILCMYASHAPFGGNIVGIRAAALKYFNRQPGQLSWAEAALLAVLPNAPALIYPGKNNVLLKQKRDNLLGKLFGQGDMTEEDYRLAMAEPLPVKVHDINCITPHLLTQAFKTKKEKVTGSYIDRQLQLRVNEIVARHSSLLSCNLIYNAAVLVAHIPSGEVRAYVGNSPACEGSRGNDVDVIGAARSSGSILKPALYALMLQNGFILPETIISDVPSRFGSYVPSNFNKDFQGVAPADIALSQSLNIPFVRMLKEYNYARFYDDLKRMGITTLNRNADHYGLSLILGGAETSLWDLCNMYGGMASVLLHYNRHDGDYFMGEYNRLKMFRSADDKMGNAKERRKGITAGDGSSSRSAINPPLSAGAIWHTFNALRNVERPELESGWKNFASNMDFAWKTGTSFGFRDAWAVGVNAEWVIGVWIGNADGEGRPGLVGVRAAAPVLFEVASLLHTENQFYEPEEEMREIIVCRKSGYRASAICDETDTVRVYEAGLRTGICPFHRLVNLDATGKWQVDSDCESVHNLKIVPWFVLTPVQEWYYSRVHTDYKKLPPYRKDCRKISDDAMAMIYPERGVRVFIPRDFDGKKGDAVFEAAHRSPAAEIYWYIDSDYIGVTRSVHQMAVNVEEGLHTLTLTDGDGNMLRQEFRVVGK